MEGKRPWHTWKFPINDQFMDHNWSGSFLTMNSNQLTNFLVFLYIKIDESVTTEAKLFSHVGATLTFFLVVWSHWISRRCFDIWYKSFFGLDIGTLSFNLNRSSYFLFPLLCSILLCSFLNEHLWQKCDIVIVHEKAEEEPYHILSLYNRGKLQQVVKGCEAHARHACCHLPFFTSQPRVSTVSTGYGRL